MRRILRSVAVVAGATLCAVAMLPAPAQAAKPVQLQARGEFVWEAIQSCPPHTSSGPCTVVGGDLIFSIAAIANRPRPLAPITVGWQLFGGTMTPGVDFTGPLSGTSVIAANQGQTYVHVPLVNDGVAELTETLQMRLTSASIPANLSSIGTGTVWNAAQIPADCTAARINSYSMSVGCTNRPPAQQWQTVIDCFHPWNMDVGYGPMVTGNGTSLGTCGSDIFRASNPWFYVQQ